MFSFFFFNDTATTEIYTLSLHDALPILPVQISCARASGHVSCSPTLRERQGATVEDMDLDWIERDRKSTRLNSSHMSISYAVFCLKKKKKNKIRTASTKQKNDEMQEPSH